MRTGRILKMNSPEKYNRENVPKTVVEDCNVKKLNLTKI